MRESQLKFTTFGIQENDELLYKNVCNISTEFFKKLYKISYEAA